jgi:O-acetyl-ADP-ribose deacetylase (regulator of RNase III)
MITYLTGDATYPQTEGNKIIAHVCNDMGRWGSGFVTSISRRWPQVGLDFNILPLGRVEIVQVENDIWIASMIARQGVRRTENPQTLKLDALKKCLDGVWMESAKKNASIHMPRIGCGRAGGNWQEIFPIIERTLEGREVFVYALPKK